jgi:hypothetical protein
LAVVLVAGCSLDVGVGDDAAVAARDREASKADWKLVVEHGGGQHEMAIERMDIYLTESEEYPEIFEIHGDGLTLVGTFPPEVRVDYEEAFERLVGKPVVILSSGGDPREPKASSVTLDGQSVPVSGGSFTVERVSGKWAGSEGNKTVRGTIELVIPGASGDQTVKGKFGAHAVTWG